MRFAEQKILVEFISAFEIELNMKRAGNKNNNT